MSLIWSEVEIARARALRLCCCFLNDYYRLAFLERGPEVREAVLAGDVNDWWSSLYTLFTLVESVSLVHH